MSKYVVPAGKKRLPTITENAKIFRRVQEWIFKNFPEQYYNPDKCEHIASKNPPKCVKCSKIVTFH